MKEEIKLEPCPFCGGFGGAYIFHPNAEHLPDRYWMACREDNDCAVHPGTDLYDTPEDAAEAWNERA